MSRYDADDGDYVLIYDGENGLRMAPRAMAAALQAQEAGELEMMPAAEAEAVPDGGRARQLLVVIGIVAGLGLLGFLVGRDWGPSKTPQVSPALAVAAEIAPPPSTAAAAHSIDRAAPRRPPQPTGRAIDRRRVEKAAKHSRAPRPAAVRKAAAPASAAACRPASTWAEWMVCHDAGLSAQDAQLARALKAASAAGAPSQDLEAGQAAWAARRNAAARRSRTEVSAAYRQRIEEVERLAKETPPF